MSDYERIAQAIDYIVQNGRRQPGLTEIAADAHLSPHHFQRLFARWVGVTPKRFLQVITVERGKRLLQSGQLPLLAASDALGLSSASRLHEHFVNLEGVTPDEYRRGGAGLEIRYGLAEGPFGTTFIAWTGRGICALAFVDADSREMQLESLASQWPGALLVEAQAEAGMKLHAVFDRAAPREHPISVYVQGTNFQIAVWRALLSIQPGELASYGQIASLVGKPRAVRAVGGAIGANPCGFLIPCHRVIRGTGELGGYRWGQTRKQAINAWEAAATDGMLRECSNDSL